MPTTHSKSYGTPLTMVFLLACAMLVATFFMLEVSPAHAQTVTFTSDMAIGSTGPQVSALQQFLATNPWIYPQGLVTGYYGSLTAAAVTQFQIAYGIPPVGQVGPLTMTKLNSLEASGLGIDISVPMIENVSVTPVNSTSATVNWTTNQVANGRVFYSTSPLTATEANASFTAPSIDGAVMASNTSGTSQSVTLSDLTPGTTYFYVVESTDSSGNVSVIWPQQSFMTLSE